MPSRQLLKKRERSQTCAFREVGGLTWRPPPVIVRFSELQLPTRLKIERPNTHAHLHVRMLAGLRQQTRGSRRFELIGTSSGTRVGVAVVSADTHTFQQSPALPRRAILFVQKHRDVLGALVHHSAWRPQPRLGRLRHPRSRAAESRLRQNFIAAPEQPRALGGTDEVPVRLIRADAELVFPPAIPSEDRPALRQISTALARHRRRESLAGEVFRRHGRWRRQRS